jgi:hypothetical protein
MLRLLIVIGRTLALGLRGQRELALENLALRQQLVAMKRAARRPRLLARDCGSPIFPPLCKSRRQHLAE